MQQNILFRVREEKYRSRINVLETLASGTTDENEVFFIKFSLSLRTFILLPFSRKCTNVLLSCGL